MLVQLPTCFVSLQLCAPKTLVQTILNGYSLQQICHHHSLTTEISWRESVGQAKPEIKKRRLLLQLRQNSKQAGQNSSEGLTYCSGMGTTMERAAAATNSASSWMPEPTDLLPTCRAVIVDIETSGLAPSASIVQLAAKCGELQFSSNVVPLRQMDPQAAAVTGLSIVGGKLYRHGQLLTTVTSKKSAMDFVEFLKNCASQVVLVGHNIIRFDAPRIINLLTMHGLLRDFCNVCFGLVDTLPLIAQGKLKKQDLLAATYLKGPEWAPLIKGAHDALTDCILLDGLLRHFNKYEVILENPVSIREFLGRQAALKKKKDIIPTLQGLLQYGVSKTMISKMAQTGVTLKELREEYTKHGRKGLEVCLGVQINGKPRVTTRKNIVDNVEKFLSM